MAEAPEDPEDRVVEGNGTVPLPGVPFHVSVTPDGLQLTLDVTLLPTVALSSGAIAIE